MPETLNDPRQEHFTAWLKVPATLLRKLGDPPKTKGGPPLIDIVINGKFEGLSVPLVDGRIAVKKKYADAKITQARWSDDQRPYTPCCGE